MTSPSFFRQLLVVAALPAAAWSIGCGKPAETKTEGGAPAGPPPSVVATTTVTKTDVPVEFDYVGQIAGSREVEVRARVTGIVERRLFDEGTRVKAGQVLFEIDPAPFQVALKGAEAELAQAEARVQQSARDFARIEPLAKTQAVSRKELDDARSASDLAIAARQWAQMRVEAARIDLGYTRVRAPLGGMVGRALKVEGSLANATGDSLLATIAQTDPVYVDFGVPEAEQMALRKEVAAGTLELAPGGFEVLLTGSDGTPIDKVGKLDFSDYKSDPQTGSFAARATIANSDGQLAPGQFVRVHLRGARRPGAIVVPQKAVMDAPSGKFVYLYKTGEKVPTAEARTVEVGEWVDTGWVIRNGLAPGDEVIVEGLARIFYSGAPVTRDAAPPAPAADPNAKH